MRMNFPPAVRLRVGSKFSHLTGFGLRSPKFRESCESTYRYGTLAKDDLLLNSARRDRV
jgi:hypothetical protein